MIGSEKGFTFIEAIISLNLLIIFCIIIVPSMSLLLQKKYELEIRNVAEDLLTDMVHLYFSSNEEFKEDLYTKNGNEFLVKIHSNNDSNSICVRWSIREKESEICEKISE
ncbi:Tfp pilus assembly protein FimT/FimU [Bacillus sp. AFS041924]|uniref:pilus assembly FimT family protein n=1 Tax=Bacillus sp. AFS041924 TaxID=2033503 RepID=UPI00159BCCE7|nr:type II secretion system protein [Bacillus sp. AFS041924]